VEIASTVLSYSSSNGTSFQNPPRFIHDLLRPLEKRRPSQQPSASVEIQTDTCKNVPLSFGWRARARQSCPTIIATQRMVGSFDVTISVINGTDEHSYSLSIYRFGFCVKRYGSKSHVTMMDSHTACAYSTGLREPIHASCPCRRFSSFEKWELWFPPCHFGWHPSQEHDHTLRAVLIVASTLFFCYG
jgi:hypothetical protein